MAKKERNFHGEADFLRHQLRALAKEMGIEIKDTNLMRKEECQARIAELSKEKYRKEAEEETRATIDNLTKELAGRNNQISELTKGIKEHEKSSAEVLEEKYKKIDELKKEIKEKNSEIAELKGERTASQLTMEKLEEKIKQSEERTQKSLDSKNDFIDKLQEELNQLRNRKWYQFWK